MIAIIDYNSGNIASVKNALKKLGFSCKVVSTKDEILKADKVIFPGVGRAGPSMLELKKLDLDNVIRNLKVPFLGICLGMQLLSDFSEEDNTRCLSVIPGQVKKFSNSVKIPQIGWNKVSFVKDSPLLKGLSDDSYFYFVNSFYFDTEEKFVIGKTDYGITFPSIIQKNNFYATQFHPEKSGEVGLKLLRNFCELC